MSKSAEVRGSLPFINMDAKTVKNLSLLGAFGVSGAIGLMPSHEASAQIIQQEAHDVQEPVAPQFPDAVSRRLAGQGPIEVASVPRQESSEFLRIAAIPVEVAVPAMVAVPEENAYLWPTPDNSDQSKKLDEILRGDIELTNGIPLYDGEVGIDNDGDGFDDNFTKGEVVAGNITYLAVQFDNEAGYAFINKAFVQNVREGWTTMTIPQNDVESALALLESQNPDMDWDNLEVQNPSGRVFLANKQTGEVVKELTPVWAGLGFDGFDMVDYSAPLNLESVTLVADNLLNPGLATSGHGTPSIFGMNVQESKTSLNEEGEPSLEAWSEEGGEFYTLKEFIQGNGVSVAVWSELNWTGNSEFHGVNPDKEAELTEAVKQGLILAYTRSYNDRNPDKKVTEDEVRVMLESGIDPMTMPVFFISDYGGWLGNQQGKTLTQLSSNERELVVQGGIEEIQVDLRQPVSIRVHSELGPTRVLEWDDNLVIVPTNTNKNMVVVNTWGDQEEPFVARGYSVGPNGNLIIDVWAKQLDPGDDPAGRLARNQRTLDIWLPSALADLSNHVREGAIRPKTDETNLAKLRTGAPYYWKVAANISTIPPQGNGGYMETGFNEEEEPLFVQTFNQ